MLKQLKNTALDKFPALLGFILLTLSLVITSKSVHAQQPTLNIGDFLGFELYLVETWLVGTEEEWLSQMQPHLAYQLQLEEQGIMFGAGPLTDPQGELNRAGLIMIRAGSYDEARAIADADPMHSSGVREYSLRKWRINEGGFELRVQFSSQTFDLE